MRISKLWIWHWGCPGVSGRGRVQYHQRPAHKGQCTLSEPEAFTQKLCKQRATEPLTWGSYFIKLRCPPSWEMLKRNPFPSHDFVSSMCKDVIRSSRHLGEHSISVEENCTFAQANLQINKGNSHINHMILENISGKGTSKGLLMRWSTWERRSIARAQELVKGLA